MTGFGTEWEIRSEADQYMWLLNIRYIIDHAIGVQVSTIGIGIHKNRRPGLLRILPVLRTATSFAPCRTPYTTFTRTSIVTPPQHQLRIH